MAESGWMYMGSEEEQDEGNGSFLWPCISSFQHRHFSPEEGDIIFLQTLVSPYVSTGVSAQRKIKFGRPEKHALNKVILWTFLKCWCWEYFDFLLFFLIAWQKTQTYVADIIRRSQLKHTLLVRSTESEMFWCGAHANKSVLHTSATPHRGHSVSEDKTPAPSVRDSLPALCASFIMWGCILIRIGACPSLAWTDTEDWCNGNVLDTCLGGALFVPRLTEDLFCRCLISPAKYQRILCLETTQESSVNI
jgi:hypothetical protein